MKKTSKENLQFKRLQNILTELTKSNVDYDKISENIRVNYH